MYIIIKKIPATITINDLERIIGPAIEGALFHKNGHIKAIKIIQFVNRKKIEVERHGLVRVDSNHTQKHLIAALNGRTMHGTKVCVSEYIVRHWSNDRRDEKRNANMPPPPNNERKGDRRRHGLRLIVLFEKLTFNQSE